jgi:hypothetical protein
MPVPAQAPAQVVVDGFTAAAAAAAKEQGQLGRGVEATGAGDRQQHASAQEGLLSRHLRQQQQQQEADELLQMQIGQQEQLAAEGLSEQLAAAQLQEQQQHRDAGPRSEAAGTAGARAAAGAAAGASAGDLTEAEEEQLMLRNTAATSGRSPAAASNSSSSSSSEGPCYLALPVQDPAQLGIWQLGASGNAQPQVVLTQGKGSGQPERGQCMAVALLQPQVRA